MRFILIHADSITVRFRASSPVVLVVYPWVANRVLLMMISGCVYVYCTVPYVQYRTQNQLPYISYGKSVRLALRQAYLARALFAHPRMYTPVLQPSFIPLLPPPASPPPPPITTTTRNEPRSVSAHRRYCAIVSEFPWNFIK